MASYIPHPPIHNHATTPVPPTRALALLSAFLSATTTDPSLHPNALLTETGPIAQSVGANIGLVLHNLKRVEAGLRGQHLGADLSFAKFGGEGLPELMATGAVPQGGGEGGKEVKEGWQDKGEFEREQDIVQGEIGPRGNEPEGEVGGEVPSVRETMTSGDKEARRARKKGRRKVLQKEAEAKRRREMEIEG